MTSWLAIILPSSQPSKWWGSNSIQVCEGMEREVREGLEGEVCEGMEGVVLVIREH